MQLFRGSSAKPAPAWSCSLVGASKHQYPAPFPKPLKKMLSIKQLSTSKWLPPAGLWQKPPSSSHRARYNHTVSSVWCWLPLRSWKYLCRAFPARLPTAVPSPYCLYCHPSDQTPKSRAALLLCSVKREFSLPLGASPDPQLLMLLLQRALQLVRVFFLPFVGDDEQMLVQDQTFIQYDLN